MKNEQVERAVDRRSDTAILLQSERGSEVHLAAPGHFVIFPSKRLL